MKISEVVACLERIKENLGDIEVGAIHEVGAPEFFVFYKVVGVGYDKYSDEEGWIAEIAIQEDEDE